MFEYFIAIAPIFVLIVAGHLLRRGGFPNTEFWNFNDRLVFWGLLPCLLFYKSATADFSLSQLVSYLGVGAGAVAGATAFAYLSARILGLPSSVASSVLNGAGRHNVFIALAVAERLFGSEGLSTAALFAAVLIPTTNLILVPVSVIIHPRPGETRVLLPALRDIARNPLIVSIALGLSFNAAGLGDVPVLIETTQIVGAAALPIVLLCIGANIRLRAIQTARLPILVSIAGKMVVFPIIIVAISMAVGLSESQMYIALLFGAAPVASSAYTLVRELGGDAPLMAGIVTIQTALSMLSLPATVEIVRWAIKSGFLSF